MMHALRVFAFAAALFACLPTRAADEEVDLKPAMAAAQAWLALVDAGHYGESWESAAPMLREAIDKPHWQASIERARGPLGVANARKLRLANFARSLPNAPAGEYAVIQFDTSFQNRPLSTELVTPMRTPDGSWRVADYIIR